MYSGVIPLLRLATSKAPYLTKQRVVGFFFNVPFSPSDSKLTLYDPVRGVQAVCDFFKFGTASSMLTPTGVGLFPALVFLDRKCPIVGRHGPAYYGPRQGSVYRDRTRSVSSLS